MLHIHDDNLLFLVLYGFLENFFLLHDLNFCRNTSKRPHTEHGTRERKGREDFPAQHRNARAPHMNQSPPAATGAREVQIFLQLLDGSTIPYCTLRPEIWLIREEICRRTNISVFNQRLTLGGRELHTGDNIPPNSTMILRFRSRGGTRSHGRFQCLDVLASVLQTPPLNTIYEQTLRTYRQVSTNWHLKVHLSLEQSQWGWDFKTKANNAAAHIEARHRRLKLLLEVEDSVNTVLDLMMCFSANQQTCMTGIKYLQSALLRPASGVLVKIFTNRQTRSVLSVDMRTLRLHGYQRTPWDPHPSVFHVQHDAEMEGDGARIYEISLPLSFSLSLYLSLSLSLSRARSLSLSLSCSLPFSLSSSVSLSLSLCVSLSLVRPGNPVTLAGQENSERSGQPSRRTCDFGCA